MTWKEFKNYVEQSGVQEDDEISWIHVGSVAHFDIRKNVAGEWQIG